MTTPLLFSGSLRSFLFSSSVYSCHLFLISSASIMSLSFLSFIVMIFGWNVPLIFPTFLKRSLVFPLLSFSSLSLYWSLKKASLPFLPFLWTSAFSWVYLSLSPLLFASFLSSAIYKVSSDNQPASCSSFSLGWFPPLLPVQCSSRTSVHSSSGILFTRSNPLNLYIISTLYS